MYFPSLENNHCGCTTRADGSSQDDIGYYCFRIDRGGIQQGHATRWPDMTSMDYFHVFRAYVLYSHCSRAFFMNRRLSASQWRQRKREVLARERQSRLDHREGWAHTERRHALPSDRQLASSNASWKPNPKCSFWGTLCRIILLIQYVKREKVW